MKFEDYPINLSPIPADEGGGYLVSIPDLPGCCIADGATINEAIAEANDAFKAWVMAEKQDNNGELPKTYSGQFVQRIPKSLHRQLAKRAETEGVSLNQLATTLLAQGLG